MERFDPNPGEMPEAKVVFFNGPPRSGKDTAANALHRVLPRSRVMKFAGILKRSVHMDFGLPPELPDDAFEPCKDEPHPAFFGKTPRQAYIEKSEKRQKPYLGFDIYGRTLLRRMWRAYQEGVRTFLLSDSGFILEALPVTEVVDRQNCLLVRIHADKRGCSFENDSRNYIHLNEVTTIDVENNGAVDEFLATVSSNVLRFLHQLP